jgi:hypothetical protein
MLHHHPVAVTIRQVTIRQVTIRLRARHAAGPTDSITRIAQILIRQEEEIPAATVTFMTSD